jgi:AcrR family transcriptional regulator
VAVTANERPSGLRERKKVALRTALIEAAYELFEAKGVDGTPVEEICAVVDVSPRTFHRYFPSKDDLFFVGAPERLARVERVLRERPESEPLLATLEAAAAAAVVLVDVPRDARREGRRLRIIEANDRLRARNLRVSEELADAIAVEVARRLDLRPSAALPQLLGAWTIAAVRTTYRRWISNPGLDLVAELHAALVTLADVTAATGPLWSKTAPGKQP